MMFHFPYLGSPYYSRYSRYGYRYPYYSYGNSNMYNKQKNNENLKNKQGIKHAPCDIQETSCKEEAHTTSDDNSPLFQLFGVNLYFDDILLICLIWFLYNEGVTDDWLFIALVLLLLS